METHPAGIKCLGYEQVTVSTNAVGLTVPDGAFRAVFGVEDQALRYRVDNTNPTATVGFLVKADVTFELYDHKVLSEFKAIRDGGSDAVLSVHYYGF